MPVENIGGWSQRLLQFHTFTVSLHGPIVDIVGEDT